MTFKQAMIVPTMATLGISALLIAQNMSLMEVSYAAPAAAGAPGVSGALKADPAKSAKPAVGGAGALPLPANAAASAEFGPQSGGKSIKATADAELAHRAVESSGREDPFMALIPPDPGQIVPPPVSFGPLKPIQTLAPLPPIAGGGATGGASGKPGALPGVKPAPSKPPVIEELPWAGETPPAASEPQWLVRGIISSRGDRISLLEGKDESVQARVGDILPDGSRVEAISSRGVTFIRGGRRFMKEIGGNN